MPVRFKRFREYQDCLWKGKSNSLTGWNPQMWYLLLRMLQSLLTDMWKSITQSWSPRSIWSSTNCRNHGRLASQDLEPESHELSETRPQLQQQLQIQQQLQESSQGQADEQEVIPNYELDYQEALIEERENEIREIEVGITELNQIFRDLGTIVQEQGGNIGTFICIHTPHFPGLPNHVLIFYCYSSKNKIILRATFIASIMIWVVLSLNFIRPTNIKRNLEKRCCAY